MKNFTKLMIALVAVVALGTACSKHPGFKKDKEGFYYKFYEKYKKEAQPQIGDLVDMTYSMRLIDSLLVDQIPLNDLMIMESLFPGDIYAAIQKMHLGDSATFILDGDSFFQHFIGQPYPFDNNDLYFDLKLKNIVPKEEYEQQEAEKRQKNDAMLEEYKLAEDSLIADYVQKHKATPTDNGLYIIKKVPGKGKEIKYSSKVQVHYTGKFLDGTVFDSSIDRGEPIELVVGQGRVILGWENALMLMKGGDKTTILIPSELAYGAVGVEYFIPPYTPLIFEMEIISVE
jgi:FKBP-type peptidyl-prolyl cis-trans isomerase